MNYRVVMTALAKTSLRNARTYIARNLANPIAAKNVYNSIMKRIKDLKCNPCLYPILDCEPFKSMGVRSFPVGSYIVYYQADYAINTVFVLKIAGGAQSPENRMQGV